MDKQKLQNKALKHKVSNKDLQEVLEDAKDGRLKDENKKKVHSLLDAAKTQEKASNEPVEGVYEWNGTTYPSLRAIPVPFVQAQQWLNSGKVKKIK